MHSVADDLRRETMAAAARLTPAQRIALALRLGDDDVALLCAAHGVTGDDARRTFRRARAAGRIPSRSHDPDAA
jgi:hypothetical protein